jgi:hypothetical protein
LDRAGVLVVAPRARLLDGGGTGRLIAPPDPVEARADSGSFSVFVGVPLGVEELPVQLGELRIESLAFSCLVMASLVERLPSIAVS